MASLGVVSALARFAGFAARGNEELLDAVVPPLWLEDTDFEDPATCDRFLRAGGDAARPIGAEGGTIAHALCGRSRHGDADVAAAVGRLAEHGLDVDAADDAGWTPLMVACDAGRADVVAALVDSGAAVDRRNARGGTALMVAAGVQETPRNPGVFGLRRPLSRSDSSRFGSFLNC